MTNNTYWPKLKILRAHDEVHVGASVKCLHCRTVFLFLFYLSYV